MSRAAKPSAAPEAFEKIDRGEMLRRAKAFIPILRDRAPRTEALRQLPRDTFDDFRRAKFFRIAQPEPYGGIGLDVDTINDVVFELARGDPSAAWVAGFFALHNHTVGAYEKAAQDEYWADSFDQCMATASAFVRGGFEDIDQGVIVTGEWDFSSGIPNADWLQIYRADGVKAQQLLIPRHSVEIVDVWHTMGARATGSNRVRLDHVLIPPHRCLDASLAATGRSHGRHAYPSVYYKLPTPMWGGSGVTAIIQEEAPRRREMTTGEMFIARAANQRRLAESSVELDCARLLLQENARLCHEWANADHEPTLLQRATMRRNMTYCVKLALNACYRLFEVSGAHAIHDDSHIQRAYRDVSAMSHALAVTWEPLLEQYGRVAWGLAPNSPLL
jgi:3-hydroxy-9,10-secoandrosta-1,3,5(10)-triene-9,17-dione monooxygenase